MKVLDFNYIKDLQINPKTLYEWENDVWKIKNKCVLPAKSKMWEGPSGRYITMPCVIPELDIAGIKFISRNVDDYKASPARNSHILLQKRSALGLLAVLDGIWITNMRTGAVAAHSCIEYSKKDFSTLGIMGLGNAARAFMYILGNLLNRNITIKLLRYKNQAELFKERFEKEFPHFTFEIVDTVNEICSCDTVVSAVSFARETFADESVFKQGCLVIPIHTGGFQNCDLVFDKIIVDDFEHCKSYKYYEQFKSKAVEISDIETKVKTGRDSDTQRILSYCGGIALHDLYYAYKILQIAEEKGNAPDFAMHYPTERFWI